ncbi:hypothetical protein NB644_00005 [Oxalobacter formigenes]|uniref:hypothetical protein n=1 Tax=Oxalobacter formigenes TaxID=847 RepID=UPI001198362B|nr:hypothetical protein [Oxalobacter formigenes]QDX32353.1 hypothetical protein FPZ51_01485 [Oxalobacter formigenes]WAW01494.1 hypothetical protein NB644_00005 [Oxalobacter formigenes]WAW03825.1 hypothetical protein NB642_00815 [Oxalobacter formigenes]
MTNARRKHTFAGEERREEGKRVLYGSCFQVLSLEGNRLEDKFERRTKEEQESGKVGQSGRGSGTGYKGIVFGRIKKAPKVS